MKHFRFYVIAALSLILADARKSLERGFTGLCSLARKLFLPSGGESPWPRKGSPFTRKRLQYLARLARVELSAARDLGVSAKEFLREGRRDVARRAARGAYLHWRKARKAFARFTAAA